MFKHLKTFLIAIVLTFSCITVANAVTVYTDNGQIDIPTFPNNVNQYYVLVKSSDTDKLTLLYFGERSGNPYILPNTNMIRFSNTGGFRIYDLADNPNNGWILRSGRVSSFSFSSVLATTINVYNSSSSFTDNNILYPADYGFSITTIIFNFHLNGGHASTNLLGFIPYLAFNDSEFSFSTEDGDFETFLTSLDIEKDGMFFEGFYYDSNFTQVLTLNDNFDEHATVIDDQKVINLYAKYRYKNVDDFLANVNLNEYTFDTNYDYAIINRGNNSDSVYMGLPFSNYELEVYEYQENNNTYKEGASACLVPIFNKNKRYYYELNTLFTNNQEVLILPKYLFDQLDPNTFDDPGDTHKFYLTDNAYVTYTNDLTHVTITNSQGQQIDTNLQNSFELSQQYKNLYENEKDIYAQIKIFLNNITRYTTAIKGMFQYLFNSLNSTIRSFIIFLVVLILLSTILRFIRRG